MPAQQYLLETLGIEPPAEGEVVVPVLRSQDERWTTDLTAARYFQTREGHSCANRPPPAQNARCFSTAAGAPAAPVTHQNAALFRVAQVVDDRAPAAQPDCRTELHPVQVPTADADRLPDTEADLLLGSSNTQAVNSPPRHPFFSAYLTAQLRSCAVAHAHSGQQHQQAAPESYGPSSGAGCRCALCVEADGAVSYAAESAEASLGAGRSVSW
ncbi:hypothetical protein ACFYXC_13185 [Streptomyces sp. NPDC002701]|uniref:hypothetical protein n=1 Tax=Streptomyces sp. NPDC002701 TaxID=3364661 RepID=UPI00367E9B7B